jgi:hypothetical protein
MLEHNSMLILQEEGYGDVLFQHGMPPHFHHEVKGFLESQFPEKQIGRDGRIIWPT